MLRRNLKSTAENNQSLICAQAGSNSPDAFLHSSTIYRTFHIIARSIKETGTMFCDNNPKNLAGWNEQA